MLISSWKVVEQFERAMAEYTGAPYAVAVDTCTAAIGLCCNRWKAEVVALPPRTYLGVACAVIHSGAKILWTNNYRWSGWYEVGVTNQTGTKIVLDSACRLYKGMYESGNTICLSFQYRKHLKIGRGGMILTDNKSDASWFRKARFCGRSKVNSAPSFVGWHCYMEPERAARGLVLLQSLPDNNKDLIFEYPDLRGYKTLEPYLWK